MNAQGQYIILGILLQNKIWIIDYMRWDVSFKVGELFAIRSVQKNSIKDNVLNIP